MPELDGLEVLQAGARRRRSAGGHHHHRQRHDRDGDQRDEARRLRLHGEAVPHGGDRRARAARVGEAPARARERAAASRSSSRVGGAPEIVTQYAPMQAVLELVARVAPSDSPVLITGESGTGKELVARMLHRLSGRAPARSSTSTARRSPRAARERAVRPRAGAFTGADERKLGLFELAAGGTLFLDEIGELVAEAAGQAAARARAAQLLSASAARRRWRSTCASLAATNRDLAARGRRGTLPRRSVLPHQHDQHRAAAAARARGRHPAARASTSSRSSARRNPPTLTADAIELLAAATVAGQRARAAQRDRARRAARARRPQIRARDLPLAAARRAAPRRRRRRRAGRSRSRSSSAATSRPCCTTTNWHQGRAASVLGISSKTLYRKIREYGFRRARRAMRVAAHARFWSSRTIPRSGSS